MGEDSTTRRGCFFCKSGKESDFVRQFEKTFPDGSALVPTRSRYRRIKDTAIEERVTLMPGYVFFELEADDVESFQSALPLFFSSDSVLKLLRYTDGSWQLHDYDDRFARLLFEAGGNIGLSQAYFDVDKRIRILSGFLKDYEGSIVRVNRKAKTVEVRVDLQGKKVSMKLGYEMVAPVDSQKEDNSTG